MAIDENNIIYIDDNSTTKTDDRVIDIMQPLMKSYYSNKEKRKRKHEKELNTLRNKMGPNLVWFNSLSRGKQFDILFLWKKEKYKNKLTKPEYKLISQRVPIDPSRPWGKKRIVKKMILKYPASLKHFLISCRANPMFSPTKERVRETTIEILLNKKIK